mmetsp:Transcript_7402/g.8096  ORF Transcript_7402/g.8096 Transcript_7402/m.8096 type:complete len:216 (-) Transcript_7402:14-661(-)
MMFSGCEVLDSHNSVVKHTLEQVTVAFQRQSFLENFQDLRSGQSSVTNHISVDSHDQGSVEDILDLGQVLFEELERKRIVQSFDESLITSITEQSSGLLALQFGEFGDFLSFNGHFDLVSFITLSVIENNQQLMTSQGGVIGKSNSLLDLEACNFTIFTPFNKRFDFIQTSGFQVLVSPSEQVNVESSVLASGIDLTDELVAGSVTPFVLGEIRL